MKSSRSLAKPALLFGGVTLLAAVVSAQVGNSTSGGANMDSRTLSLLYQYGTTTGTTGGNGGVITGPKPRPLSEVTVTDPSTTQRP